MEVEAVQMEVEVDRPAAGAASKTASPLGWRMVGAGGGGGGGGGGPPCCRRSCQDGKRAS